MARGLSPLAYRPGKSPLHRLPAGLKLGALFALSLFALLPHPLFLLPPALAAAAGARMAGLSPGGLLRGSRPLLSVSLGAALLRGLRFSPPAFDPGEFLGGCRFGGGLLVSFALASLFFSVSTMAELRYSLEALELFLGRRFPGGPRRLPRLSLGIALMLGFLPRFFEVWENAVLAWEARGGKRGPRMAALLIPLTAERMLRIAWETSEALENRGL